MHAYFIIREGVYTLSTKKTNTQEAEVSDSPQDVMKVANDLFQPMETPAVAVGDEAEKIGSVDQLGKQPDTSADNVSDGLPKEQPTQQLTHQTLATEVVEQEINGALVEQHEQPDPTAPDQESMHVLTTEDNDAIGATKKVYIPIRLIPQFVEWNNTNVECHHMNLVDTVTGEVVSEFDMPYLEPVLNDAEDLSPVVADEPNILRGRIYDIDMNILYVTDPDVICMNDVNEEPTCFVFPMGISDVTYDVLVGLDYSEKMDILISLGCVSADQIYQHEDSSDAVGDGSSSFSDDIDSFLNM